MTALNAMRLALHAQGGVVCGRLLPIRLVLQWFPDMMMKFATPLLLAPLGFLASCAMGPNEVVSDLYSPNKQYHVEVRKCPQVGSLTWSEEEQASILKAGHSGVCHSSEGAIEQFSVNAPEDQLELEWNSETQLRAWHPRFNPRYGPERYVSGQNDPVKVVFRPKN